MTATVDLRPGRLDIKTTRGDDVGVPIDIREGGELADLTGRTYEAQLRRTADSATVSAEVTVDTTGAAAGRLVLRLEDAVTDDLKGVFYWDLEQTIGGTVRTILAGRWTFDADVTRDDDA